MAYHVVDIKTIREEKKLNSSISIPSAIHSFSLSIEYMRDWFLSKFDKDFFKTVYIDSKHVVDDFRTMNKTQMIKRQKPMVAIVPQLDFAFNRDNIDMYQYGLNLYAPRGKFSDSFFKDLKKDIYLGMGLECNLINFTFRMRFSTRAQQMDMFKYMKLAYRVGQTQGYYTDMDFHVPYSLMLQLALDAGFIIENNKIKNIIEFLHYMNSNTDMKFLYKFRCINGKDEFFIRVPNLYVHINASSLDADDGEREGQLQNNYGIDMQVAVRFPSPQMFTYYSKKEHIKITLKEEVEDAVVLATVKLNDYPLYDENGWRQYLTTEYNEKDLENPLVIDFKELFGDGDIARVVKYNNSINISSKMFLDIKIYNENLIPYDIDWETLILTAKEPVCHPTSNIIIYADLDYITRTLSLLDSMETTRIKNKE